MTPGIIRRAKRTLFQRATSGVETQGGHLGNFLAAEGLCSYSTLFSYCGVDSP